MTRQDSGRSAEASAEHSPQNSAGQPVPSSYGNSAEFLSNYRLGRTLGIGSFGKVLSRALSRPCSRNTAVLSFAAAVLTVISRISEKLDSTD